MKKKIEIGRYVLVRVGTTFKNQPIMSNSRYTSKIVSSETLTKSTALQLHDKATKNFPSCKRFMYNYHTVKQKVLRKAIETHRNMHLLLIAMAIKMNAFPNHH